MEGGMHGWMDAAPRQTASRHAPTSRRRRTLARARRRAEQHPTLRATTRAIVDGRANATRTSAPARACSSTTRPRPCPRPCPCPRDRRHHNKRRPTPPQPGPTRPDSTPPDPQTRNASEQSEQWMEMDRLSGSLLSPTKKFWWALLGGSACRCLLLPRETN